MKTLNEKLRNELRGFMYKATASARAGLLVEMSDHGINNMLDQLADEYIEKITGMIIDNYESAIEDANEIAVGLQPLLRN